MHVTFSESGEVARVITMEYHEKGDIIQIDDGLYYVIHRGIHLRRWAYHVRKATPFEIFLSKIGAFWKRVFA